MRVFRSSHLVTWYVGDMRLHVTRRLVTWYIGEARLSHNKYIDDLSLNLTFTLHTLDRSLVRHTYQYAMECVNSLVPIQTTLAPYVIIQK